MLTVVLPCVPAIATPHFSLLINSTYPSILKNHWIPTYAGMTARAFFNILFTPPPSHLQEARIVENAVRRDRLAVERYGQCDDLEHRPWRVEAGDRSIVHRATDVLRDRGPGCPRHAHLRSIANCRSGSGTAAGGHRGRGPQAGRHTARP